MPTYQYTCTACGADVEAVQKFTDDPLESCPQCEGRLRKVYSAVGVVFKGSGFYRNDSRSGASSSASNGNGSTGAKGGDGDAKDTGTDAAASAESAKDSSDSAKSSSDSTKGASDGASSSSGSGDPAKAPATAGT